MKVDVLLGLQWGDEGKGKIVDTLTPNYDIIARFQGGPNAGHTIEIGDTKHVLHLIPSGIFHQDKINLIGNGVVIDPVIFQKEVEALQAKGLAVENNLYISRKAHLILPTHRLLDAVSEQSMGKQKIGSTLKGIGPTYTDKVGRKGLRVGDITSSSFQERHVALVKRHLQLAEIYDVNIEDIQIDGFTPDEYEQKWFEAIEFLKSMKLVDGEYFINNALKKGKTVLAEGAQGSMLDIDFGTYPFVTSSNTVCAGVCMGLGVSPSKIGKVFGISKVYCTRVGSGPFPTEIEGKEGESLRKKGNEFGATTGRPRRCGWIDLVALNYSIMLNGVTHLILTKADVLSGLDHISVCENYIVNEKLTNEWPYDVVNNEPKVVFTKMKSWQEDIDKIKSKNEMPASLQTYIEYVEKKTNVPVLFVSVGPDRSQIVKLS